ncbi:Glu/Leu/Phe/Val dehydrogenase dimerization domain-containing protein [Rhizobium leguminosarum]
METLAVPTSHEHLQMKPGRRTRLPIIIGVHSTVLGPAIGGLRIKHYENAFDGVADVLRLSQAMTIKAAAIDNGTGGGKTVVPLPQDLLLTPELKEAILLDIADHVHSLDGIYHVAPDVGTGPLDIDIIRRRTPYVGGYSKEAGGAGGTTFGTYAGVKQAIRTAAQIVFGRDTLTGMTVSIVGLGGIGSLLAETFAKEGAELIVADINPARKELADKLGARWATPEEALLAQCDILAPCALGGILNKQTVSLLKPRLICGAANNQLASDDIAKELSDRGIVYVPDFIANAGGLMYASGIELHHRSETASIEHTISSIERNVKAILEHAEASKITTHAAAVEIAEARLGAASRLRN